MAREKQKNTAAHIEREERRNKALQLRLAGAQFGQIGAQLGISRSLAHKLVVDGLADLRKENHQAAEDLRATIAVRLDMMLLGLWDRARKGDVKAIESARRLEADRARLYGLHDHDEDLVIPGVPLGADGLPIPAAPTGPGGALFRVMSAEEVETIRASTRKSAGVLPAE